MVDAGVLGAGLVLAGGGVLQSQAVRDSAGVQIVTSTRPLLPEARAWRVDERPLVRIGGSRDAPDDTLYEFLRVMGVSRLSDGRIAVGVQGSHSIRFFDAAGRFVASAGRSGQGPGEFRQILGMAATRGDTLAVTDLGEVEFYDGTGKFIRQGASRRSMGDFGFVYPQGFLGDGSYPGMKSNERTIPPSGLRTTRSPLVRVHEDGARVDTIDIVPYSIEEFDGRQTWGTHVVFSPWASVAAGRGRIYYGFAERYEVREYAESGGLIRLIRRERQSRPVGRAEKRVYIEHTRTARANDPMHPMSPQMKERFEQSLAETRFADRFPEFRTLLPDRSGNLWVERYDWRVELIEPGLASVRTLSAPGVWDVFDPVGRWLCTVSLPARFTPLEVGADYVAGLARAEDDVEEVRLYRLRKP